MNIEHVYHSLLLQAPTYHVVIEVVLGLWIFYLLIFSKQYRPKSKHDKLTEQVCPSILGHVMR